ncbi:MAG: nicotinate-nucleotide--dimethylbenzimidazole phosphoribosyltransferase [Geminicoccaceae bacterium]
MAFTPSSLAEVRAVLRALPEPDAAAAEAARAREGQLTKPAGALGRLEELAAWMAAWQGRHPPKLERIRVAVFAGWNGITEQGVSAYPAVVTDQMIANFTSGGAAVNQLSRLLDAELVIVPVAPGQPTKDFTTAPAMSELECVDAFVAGLDTVHENIDLLAVGEMGIGNTTTAAAIAAALYGGGALAWTGPGTGLDQTGVRHKAAVIERGLALHAASLGDPLAVLCRLGGREIAAMAGAILGARLCRVPVILDGYVATTAAAVLHALEPTALAHCQAGHRSAEPAHGAVLEKLGLVPLLDLGMRLGEASGAALAAQIVRAAVACHTGMATFADAGVSGKA